MNLLILVSLFSSFVTYAEPGDYANWGPAPEKRLARSGSGIACGQWGINDYGSHPQGKTSVTIFTRIPARPDLGFLNVEFDSARAHQVMAENEGRCICMTYTWASNPDPKLPRLEYWDFEPASDIRICPQPTRHRDHRP